MAVTLNRTEAPFVTVWLWGRTVMLGGAGLTAIVTLALPVPPALLADKATAFVLSCEGVPEIRPDAVFTERPTGRFSAVNEVGLPLAVIW